ncbi:MAG: sulfatase [Opitutaceae bacterium]|nr:sulfatase [Opitutaceae bacterium]
MKTLRVRSVLFLALLVTVVASASAATARKPNFLFIYTDDQRWDAMSVVQREQGERARFPWFQSPHMDRLAAEGVRFRNAFVTLSLCAPSRAAYLTGRYNHANGVANNHTPFPVTSVTHASLLRAAGYQTAYIGKWHHGSQSGQRPGFDYSASFVGQGRYFNCPVEINGASTPTTGWIDDVSTDFAIAFMQQNRARPFSMVVGFKSPHGPRGGANLPERLRTKFADETSRPVPNLASPAIYRPAAPSEGKATTGARVNDAHLDYLRHIAGADENLGRLLQTLDDLGLTDDTVVVYASDNGYYLGEHGLGDKRSLYEESLRIPLLVRYPRLVPKGITMDEMVLNIDLAPTLLELGGVPVPHEMQGLSWVPLLTGKKPAWRQSFLAEYFYENNFETPTMLGVRTANAKIIQYPGHPEWTEVFDLAIDSYEMKNLAADPARRVQLTAELDAQIKATGYVVPAGMDQPGQRTEKAAKKKAKAKQP